MSRVASPRAASSAAVVRAWCLYDWANSAFATTVMAAVLPPYFARVAAADMAPSDSAAIWGYATSALLFLAAVLSPLIGALTDHFRASRPVLAIAVAIGAAGTAALYLVERGDWMLAIGAYGVGYLAFVASTVVSDGMLLTIAAPADRDRISSRAFALGYAGGGLLLAVHAAWIVQPGWFGFADAGVASRVAFLSVGVWWALFSVPLIRYAPPTAAGSEELFRHPLARLRATLTSGARLREAWKFLIAFWLYNDGVGTVIKMATIYGAVLGFGTAHLIGALLLVQILGIPFTLLAARIAQRVGARPVILGGLGVYVVAVFLAFFMTQPLHFYLLAAMIATSQGAVQALSRSLYSQLVPAEQAAEMYGFYSVSHKFAGLFGPLCFGIVSQVTGEPRLATLVILPFLVFGGAALLTVRTPATTAPAQG